MKRSSQATSDRESPTRDTPAGGLAQPDERDQTPAGTAVDRKTIGPRQIIQQAARDVARGLQDTDLHGTSTNVPGPPPRQAEPMVSPAGNRRSYADDQRATPAKPVDRVTPPKSS
ncbi:hypothetical protein LZ012_17155 [Dechloromonas sp. XY25]|uniref:Uncharacterized protein n=1 Tax=Dechloromonas hankyongensis TaxID=2908002 RepID=A0ABS9K6D8_9RHOO|nr:hypothetical protein [Dechloromonas hankyongensis]MCG2578728.1 hypothetical protein [Dechloromonas hankyongensis]